MTPRPFVGFRIDADKLTEVDQAAAELGVRRSDVIRRAVDQYLAKRRRDHERKQR